MSREKNKHIERFMQLEGLRGIAAIVVVAYHAMLMFWPGVAYGTNPSLAPVQNSQLESFLYGNPLNVFLSGGFAVAIFFVLSGFVLSVGFFQTGDGSIVQRLAAKRYVRLMIPALISVLAVFLIVSLGMTDAKDGVVAITHSGSLAKIWQLTPNFFSALSDGSVAIFTQSGSAYNAVLWTMYYEFIGSFLVFITLLVCGRSKYRGVVYGGLLIATFGTWFSAIVMGMILADIYVSKSLSKLSFKLKPLLCVALLGTGLILGGYPILSPAGTFYGIFHIAALTDDQNTTLYLSIGACMVVGVLLLSRTLTKVFSHPRVAITGKYTYALYLTHTLVLFTVGSKFFLFFNQYMGINRAAIVTIIAIAPVVALVTWAFQKMVDAPSIKFSNYLSDIYFGKAIFKRSDVTGFIARPFIQTRQLAKSIYHARRSYSFDEIE